MSKDMALSMDEQEQKLNDLLFAAYDYYMVSDIPLELFVGKLESIKYSEYDRAARTLDKCEENDAVAKVYKIVLGGEDDA